MLSLKYITESKPEHPNDVVVKNQFYPKGLTQEQIYNYYVSHKIELLNSVNDREIIIFFCVDINKFIVKRRDPIGGFFKLNNNNFSKIISGRTISIHSTMKQKERFGIIDIDTIDFNKGKNVTGEIYDYLYKENKHISIRFTGKNSFHIIYNFKNDLDINNIRSLITNFLGPFSDKYHIGIGERENIGLDLSPNKFRGGFISLHSLSIDGLKCMEVSRQNLSSFKKEDAKIGEL